jgi:hypothetical protein
VAAQPIGAPDGSFDVAWNALVANEQGAMLTRLMWRRYDAQGNASYEAILTETLPNEQAMRVASGARRGVALDEGTDRRLAFAWFGTPTTATSRRRMSHW